MTTEEFYRALTAAANVVEVEKALKGFETEHGDEIQWVPFGGRENNRGVIEVSTDPGRSLVERLTNAIDAVLEAEHERHGGIPDCRSPKEAATAWLNVPDEGLYEMTPTQRRGLAQRVAVRIRQGDGRDGRVVEVRDLGIGLTPEQMPKTILSLNESNKVQKHYLAGIYGQGGSATLAVSKYTLVASRYANHPTVGFTVVRFLDLPADQYKTGHYVYLTLGGRVLEAALTLEDFPAGTKVNHYGYDLNSYPSPLGPNSVYGLLNRVLFDPVMPVWLDNPVNNQRRVIKGARNALNGAVDEDDEDRRGPNLSHHMRMFYVTVGDFGRIGIEYWVLEQPTQANKRPTAAFVNPGRPIVLTINGQNHAELLVSLVKKDAELPYLAQRLICHVDCNHLIPPAKRALFVSTREDVRLGTVYQLVQQELVRSLKSDDELTRLNSEARERSRHAEDAAAVLRMRSEVARLLRLHGMDVLEPMGAEVERGGSAAERPTHPRSSRPQPQPIELHEPPTYIRFLWDRDEPITFYPGQRRYMRIETDANSPYHNPNNPAVSRVNIIVSNGAVTFCGSTPLLGGRMRAILECVANAALGDGGSFRVELARTGLPTLSDQRSLHIVEPPPVRPDTRRIPLPSFDVREVQGPEDPLWPMLGWPEEVVTVASSAVLENGRLVVYYSTVFPDYSSQRASFERRDPVLAKSFTERYKIWLAVHSLLVQRDQQTATLGSAPAVGREDSESVETRERQERCRAATLSVFFAHNEVVSRELPGENE